jgi:hypothetical protein
MARLSIGDRVSDLAGTHGGTLVDIDGKTGYVMQTNGVEIEFALDRLKPYQEPEADISRTLSGPNRDRTLSPAHRALLASVPAQIRDAVAQSYDAGAEPGARPAFAELPDDKKLETIRIYLPTLPQRLLMPHVKLVVAFRDLAKKSR